MFKVKVTLMVYKFSDCLSSVFCTTGIFATKLGVMIQVLTTITNRFSRPMQTEWV